MGAGKGRKKENVTLRIRLEAEKDSSYVIGKQSRGSATQNGGLQDKIARIVEAHLRKAG